MKAKTTTLDIDGTAWLHFIYEAKGESVEFSCKFPEGQRAALSNQGMNQAASQALARFRRLAGKTGLMNEAAPDQKALTEKINANK